MIKLLFCFLLFFSLGCSKDSSESLKNTEVSHEKYYYTCSMHPQVKENSPGKCPICHMNLTKVEIDESSEIPFKYQETKVWQCKDFPDVTSELETVCPIDGSPMILKEIPSVAGEILTKLKLKKSQKAHFIPEFFPATLMKMTKKVRLLGSVLQSEEKESTITARIGGRIEKVFVKSTGSMVRIGGPVLNLYSPKLITAGEEYLLARQSFEKNSAKEFQEMLKQSEERLKLWGIRSFQYEKWYKSKKVPKEITIYSNSTGIVRRRNAIVGKYFKEGQNFFELSDLSDVWVEMDVYEQDSSLIQIGQKVQLEFIALPGVPFWGNIDFVNPVLDQKSRTLKIRTTIKNSEGKLRPGMVANAVLILEMDGMPLVVPRSAIIDTGKRKVVWTQISESTFQAKTVLTGYESEGHIEVKSGLKEGEKVVVDGNFLLDAQAQLTGGYEDIEIKDHHNH